MKGKTTYQFKKILFQSSRIDIAGGWHVGNKADNPACRYPKRGTDRDLIYNHSAITLENLMAGKLKAALLNMEDGTQILYFQYQSSSNGQIQAVVIPEHPMRIEVDRDVDQAVKRIGKRAGVTKVHCHRFRHTLASNLATKMPITEVADILGHDDISTTQVYVHSDPASTAADYRRAMA